MGKLAYQTLHEDVMDVIRMRIFNHRLAPGMRTTEQDVSGELGVNHRSIREALRQLGQEGLAEYVGNVGCSVKSITLKDTYEIYPLRATYEILAVKLYRGVFSETTFVEMDAALGSAKDLKRTDCNRSIVCDSVLHETITRSTGLPRLIERWTDLNYGNAINYYAGNPSSRAMIERQYPTHKELMDVYRTGGVEEICRVISNHYVKTIRRWLKEQGISEDHSKFSIDVIDG